MARRIRIEVSGFDGEVTATLVEADEAEFSNMVWEEFAAPVKLWMVHTTSTGDWINARPRPSTIAKRVGTQASPLGMTSMMCDIAPGSVLYTGHRSLAFCYGPDVTEPLPTRGPVIARADDADAFYRAGRHICDSHFRTHQLVIATVSRHGESL